jgi:hypothetical protein
MPAEPSSPDRRHLAPAIIDLLHEKFDPEAKQLVTSFEPENLQIFIDEDRLQHLGLTLRDLARFLESQPFLFAVFTNDDVRRAVDAAKPPTRTRASSSAQTNSGELNRALDTKSLTKRWSEPPPAARLLSTLAK